MKYIDFDIIYILLILEIVEDRDLKSVTLS